MVNVKHHETNKAAFDVGMNCILNSFMRTASARLCASFKALLLITTKQNVLKILSIIRSPSPSHLVTGFVLELVFCGFESRALRLGSFG
jgi:hypothetical protein